VFRADVLTGPSIRAGRDIPACAPLP